MKNKKHDVIKWVVLFLLLWFGNTVVFIIANTLAPDSFALGNSYMTPQIAAIASGFVLAGIISFLEPGFLLLYIQVKHNLTWALIFWFVNAEVIWAMGRYAEYTGIGLEIYWVALVVGFVAKVVQWLSWMLVKKL